MPEDQMAVAHRRYYKAKAAMENVVRAIDALLAMDHNRVPLKLAAQLTATSDGLKAECDHIVAVWD